MNELKFNGKDIFECNKGELNIALQMLNNAWDNAERMLAFAYHPGQIVRWDGKKGSQEGVVTKVNIKTISVLVGTVRWKVSPSLLTIVQKAG